MCPYCGSPAVTSITIAGKAEDISYACGTHRKLAPNDNPLNQGWAQTHKCMENEFDHKEREWKKKEEKLTLRKK